MLVYSSIRFGGEGVGVYMGYSISVVYSCDSSGYERSCGSFSPLYICSHDRNL